MTLIFKVMSRPRGYALLCKAIVYHRCFQWSIGVGHNLYAIGRWLVRIASVIAREPCPWKKSFIIFHLAFGLLSHAIPAWITPHWITPHLWPKSIERIWSKFFSGTKADCSKEFFIFWNEEQVPCVYCLYYVNSCCLNPLPHILLRVVGIREVN